MDIWPAAAQRVHAIRSTKRRKRWDVAEANPKASRPVGTVLAWTRWQCQFSLLHWELYGHPVEADVNILYLQGPGLSTQQGCFSAAPNVVLIFRPRLCRQPIQKMPRSIQIWPSE